MRRIRLACFGWTRFDVGAAYRGAQGSRAAEGAGPGIKKPPSLRAVTLHTGSFGGRRTVLMSIRRPTRWARKREEAKPVPTPQVNEVEMETNPLACGVWRLVKTHDVFYTADYNVRRVASARQNTLLFIASR
tara:strand:+ start:87 stop:482 length:396 start_codon:yes stop_codon:yes gene_type:complete